MHTQEKEEEELNSFLNEIGCLTKLKELQVHFDSSSDLIEVTIIASRIATAPLTSSQIVRSCRQVEILWMRVDSLAREDLARLEPAENKTDLTLRWEKGPSIEHVLPVLRRWRHLNRLTLDNSASPGIFFPAFNVLSDFIMAMDYLSYLHIVPDSFFLSNDYLLKILSDQVNDLVLPWRPSFKLDLSPSDD